MLAKLMPQEEWDELSAVLIPNKEPNISLFLPQAWLSSVDITWILPTLQKLPKALQQVYARAFPKELGNALGPGEKTEAPLEVTYNDRLRDFLLSYLHKIWTEKEVMPKELLPSLELSHLLRFTRLELMEIVDLLAMHDLVEEMRHIVDKRLLQSILQYLTSTQQHYLRVLLRQKSRQQPSTLSVRELLKDGKKFPQMLHKFGIQRLAMALSGVNDDFIWHLSHTFDIYRAKFLHNYIQKEEMPNQTHVARLQVQHIIQFLKTETTS